MLHLDVYNYFIFWGVFVDHLQWLLETKASTAEWLKGLMMIGVDDDDDDTRELSLFVMKDKKLILILNLAYPMELDAPRLVSGIIALL